MTSPARAQGPDGGRRTAESAMEALLFRLADDEFVIAERYTEWQIFAPTLESDLALSNVAQDEYGHARLWYDILQDEFDYTEADVLWERDPAAFTHSTLCELPFPEGGWDDVVVRSYLYDTAERLRLEALLDSSSDVIRDRVTKALGEEDYHREHAVSWLERLAETATGQDRLQAAVDRLFPHAMSLFDAGPREGEILEAGLRTETLGDLREEWFDVVIPTLEGHGLVVPDPGDVDRPDERGRDGTHTEDWFDMYETFTETYRELNFDQPTRLRGAQS